MSSLPVVEGHGVESTANDFGNSSVTNVNGSNGDRLQQPKKRKRVSKACDACSKRKIQCDAESPQCNWCKHHDMPCTFDRITRRPRKQATRLHAEPLSNPDHSEGSETTRFSDNRYYRIDSPSQLIVQRSSLPSIHGRAFGSLHFAGCRLGQVSSSRGLPLITSDGQRWVESVTGEKVDFDRLYGKVLPDPIFVRDAAFQPTSTTSMPTTSTGLPPRWMADQCLNMFARSVKRLVFPVVDPILFRRTISLAYDGEILKEAAFECITARASVFVFLAFSHCLIAESVGDDLRIDPDYCISEALKLYRYATLSSSLDGLQALLGLSVHALFRGNSEAASIYMSSAAGAVIRLGGHLSPNTQTHSAPPSPTASTPLALSIDARITKHIRNLFWLSFTVDFMITLHSGMPPSFDIAFCDLTLPPNYEQMYAQQAVHGIHNTLPEGTDYDPWFPGDIRLTIIQAKAQVKLYSHYAMSKSDAELLRDIRELDMEVDAWRESVPPLFRPSWVHSQHLPTSGHLNIVILRLLFYHIIALIHRASSRCQAWLNMQPRWDIDALGSSLALSVEASRSSLLYISNVADKVTNSFFSMILIFPMTSFIVLFCNLLLNPLDEQAASDLALLDQVPDTIRRLKLRNLSMRQTGHMELVYDFVRELGRLGKCAIEKARRERGGDGGEHP